MYPLIADIVISTSGLIGLVVLILDIIAIVSVVAGYGSAGHKILWTILILCLPVLGMILYFLIGQSRSDARVI